MSADLTLPGLVFAVAFSPLGSGDVFGTAFGEAAPARGRFLVGVVTALLATPTAAGRFMVRQLAGFLTCWLRLNILEG